MRNLFKFTITDFTHCFDFACIDFEQDIFDWLTFDWISYRNQLIDFQSKFWFESVGPFELVSIRQGPATWVKDCLLNDVTDEKLLKSQRAYKILWRKHFNIFKVIFLHFFNFMEKRVNSMEFFGYLWEQIDLRMMNNFHQSLKLICFNKDHWIQIIEILPLFNDTHGESCVLPNLI